MRITRIETDEQRLAVAAAAVAAQLLVQRVPGVKLLELSSEAIEGTQRKYEPFAAWSATDMDESVRLWSDTEDEQPHPISVDDMTRLTSLLTLAGETDPNVFGADGLAYGTWELDIDAVLRVGAGLDLERLVA